jgi:broad specificity phosphatase PhoE
MSTLFMIRHGQASFGKENYDELSDIGRKQSQILGERLINSGIRFDAIYSGTLVRQNDTADLSLSALASRDNEIPEIQKMDAFNEYDSEGVLRGLIPVMEKEDDNFKKDVKKIFNDKKSFQRVFEKVMLRWVSGEYDIPGLMQWKAFCRCVEQGIEHIMNSGNRGKTVALFTSGGPIAVAVRKALHLTDPDTLRVSWQVVNSSISCFKYSKNRFMLSTFNDHSHLEAHLVERCGESHGNRLITYR